MGEVLKPVLAFLAKRRRFLASEAAEQTGLTLRQVRRCLDRLVREGFLRVAAEEEIVRDGREVYGRNLRNPRYERIKDASLHPGLKKSGTCRDQIWRTIRVKRRFTRSDLVVLTSCSPGNVDDYIRLLIRDGYVRQAGKRGRAELLVLVGNVGPVRPPTPEEEE